MAPGRLLQRNVQPRGLDSDEDAEEDEISLESGVESPARSSEHEGSTDGEDEKEEEEEDDDDDVELQISNVSFGALKDAQDSLVRKRKRGSESTPEQEEKLETLRARLRQIKNEKEASSTSKRTKENSGNAGKSTSKSKTNPSIEQDPDASASDSNSDSPPSEQDLATNQSRTSKHAPASQSSKHPVTRKRTVVDVPKRTPRDPRFDAVSHKTSTTNNGSAEKAYNFLHDYQKSEIADLQSAVKLARSESEKSVLRRKIDSMQNRLKSHENRAREREIVRKHRKEEREKIEHGKAPFYLKNSAIKEKALVEKFNSMKAKEREKTMQKRRLRESQKERKRMPEARRVVG